MRSYGTALVDMYMAVQKQPRTFTSLKALGFHGPTIAKALRLGVVKRQKQLVACGACSSAVQLIGAGDAKAPVMRMRALGKVNAEKLVALTKQHNTSLVVRRAVGAFIVSMAGAARGALVVTTDSKVSDIIAWSERHAFY